MPLESLTQKRSRLVDPRPRWAIIRMNSFGTTEPNTKDIDYALIEMNDTRLALLGDRRDQLCKAFSENRKLAGMVTPRWFDLGIWILSKDANNSVAHSNDFISKWLGDAESTVRYGLRDTGFHMIMEEIKFPTVAKVTRVTDISLGIAPYPTNPKYSSLVVFTRLANGPDVASFSLPFTAIEKHIDNARQRIAAGYAF